MRTRTRTLAAALVAASAIAAGTSVAEAAPTYLKHPDSLHFPARTAGEKSRPCIRGTVFLPKGNFVNGAYMLHTGHRTSPDLRSLPMRITVPGRFNWEVCRGYNTNIRHYQVRTTVTARGFKNSVLNTIQNTIDSRVLFGPGSYEWGGRIALDVPLGSTHLSR